MCTLQTFRGVLKRDRASCAHPPAGTATPAHGTNGPEVGDVHENRSIGPGRAPDTALLATYSEGVETTIRFVHDVLASATTFEEFRTGIFTANASNDSPTTTPLQSSAHRRGGG